MQETNTVKNCMKQEAIQLLGKVARHLMHILQTLSTSTAYIAQEVIGLSENWLHTQVSSLDQPVLQHFLDLSPLGDSDWGEAKIAARVRAISLWLCLIQFKYIHRVYFRLSCHRKMFKLSSPQYVKC